MMSHNRQRAGCRWQGAGSRGTAVVIGVLLGSLPLNAQQAPLGGWPQHSRARPAPPVVTPGPHVSVLPPRDAVVLFDGASLNAWMMSDSTPAKWRVVDGAFEVTPGTGTLVTRAAFGDVQLHIEFMSPNPPKGNDQDRGNSGVFFGGGRYEVQVLDSYNNSTYADGQAASLYGQYPPLVNASRVPGEWQSYDITYKRPRFGPTGKVLQPAVLTVVHNGVLVQDHRALIGPTANGSRPPYEKHEDRLPLMLQDHDHPVRFRNVWVRNLEALPQETVQYRTPQGDVFRALGETDAIVKARAALGGNYRNVSNVIALGVAQSGARQFREAIATFTRGLAALPASGRNTKDEAMLLRWRGHRYLSVREFAKAEADLTRGLALDGTNYGILFHLGVLRFHAGRFADAAALFARAQPIAPDGGERAGSTDWLWMSLARAGRVDEANAMLAKRIDQQPDPKPAPPGYAYVTRLKLYRGETDPIQVMMDTNTDDVTASTLLYGLGNWFMVQGDTAGARILWEGAVRSGGWPGFGFNVAEAELRRLGVRAR
jgi:tetratricopeptide (TPR) repeat protein